jgi:anti-anti-sigma factor
LNISIVVSDYPQNKSVTLVTVNGFIDTLTAPEFEQKFLSTLEQKNLKLIVDLKGVNYISSAGWGVFISEIRRIRSQKGDLVLAGMVPAVSEVFGLLEFNSFLRAFPDVESAAQKGFEKFPAKEQAGHPEPGDKK